MEVFKSSSEVATDSIITVAEPGGSAHVGGRTVTTAPLQLISEKRSFILFLHPWMGSYHIAHGPAGVIEFLGANFALPPPLRRYEVFANRDLVPAAELLNVFRLRRRIQ
jgi:hypothetical protein